MEKIGLYIHIPFCVSKCSYCNFVSFPNCENKFFDYLNALKIEIEKRAKECSGKHVATIYIGGGTPSILPNDYIPKILDCIRQHYILIEKPEISVEANPNSFDYEKAKAWASAGVNRISFGLQAAQKKLLKVLNRPHNFKDFKNAVFFAHLAGIKNINADILLGIPKQNWACVRSTIKKVINCGVKHISAYGLILEEGTPLFNSVKSGKLTIPTDEKSVSIYKKTRKYLDKFAFIRYEISNFCLDGYECKHNLNYWSRGEFVGFGVAAYSFLNGVHWENTTNLDEYIANPNSKLNIEKETEKTAKEETIMLALRTDKGLDLNAFNKKFNVHFIKEYQKQLIKLLKDGAIIIKDDHLKVLKTEITNLIIEEFF